MNPTVVRRKIPKEWSSRKRKNMRYQSITQNKHMHRRNQQNKRSSWFIAYLLFKVTALILFQHGTTLAFTASSRRPLAPSRKEHFSKLTITQQLWSRKPMCLTFFISFLVIGRKIDSVRSYMYIYLS